MRNIGMLLAALAISGCTMSSAGLYRTHVRTTVDSQKSPQAFATCVAETMMWNPQLRGEGGHYWILRTSQVGAPLVRWDFTARPDGGSRAELRATISLNAGDERVRACA